MKTILSLLACTALGLITTTSLRAEAPVKPESIREVLEGATKYAVRFIHAPAFTFAKIPGAATLAATFTDSQKQAIPLAGNGHTLDLAPIWERMAAGEFTGRVELRDAAGKVLHVFSGNWHKARPFDSALKQPEPPRPPDEVAKKTTEFLLGYRHPKAHAPDQSAMLWHAACNIKGGLHPYVYPAWGHAILIHFLLDYAEWPQADAKLSAAGLALIPELIQVIQAHKTPSDWLYGDLYYSTGSRGEMGGHADADGIMPTMSGHTGLALLRVAEKDGNPDLRRAAWATGLSLVKVQLPEGNFIFRVQPKTGEVASPYTSNVMPVVLLWDALLASPADTKNPLDTEESRQRIRDARAKALAWMLAGPWKNMRWEGLYEDMANLKPYENMQWWDASLAVEYVLARPDEFPGQKDQALAVARWIEDQFVCWHEEDVPNRGKRVPLVPCALEQYRCYQPIDAHAARAAGLFLTVWRATGDESYRARARAMATSLARAQRESGAIATWWWMGANDGAGETRMEFDPLNDWFRCMAYDASLLIKHGGELQAAPPEP